MLPFEPVAAAVGGGIAGAPFFTGPFVRINLHVSIDQSPLAFSSTLCIEPRKHTSMVSHRALQNWLCALRAHHNPDIVLEALAPKHLHHLR